MPQAQAVMGWPGLTHAHLFEQVNFTSTQLPTVVDRPKPKQIRTMSVIAHVDHGDALPAVLALRARLQPRGCIWGDAFPIDGPSFPAPNSRLRNVNTKRVHSLSLC